MVVWKSLQNYFCVISNWVASKKKILACEDPPHQDLASAMRAAGLLPGQKLTASALQEFEFPITEETFIDCFEQIQNLGLYNGQTPKELLRRWNCRRTLHPVEYRAVRKGLYGTIASAAAAADMDEEQHEHNIRAKKAKMIDLKTQIAEAHLESIKLRNRSMELRHIQMECDIAKKISCVSGKRKFDMRVREYAEEFLEDVSSDEELHDETFTDDHMQHEVSPQASAPALNSGDSDGTSSAVVQVRIDPNVSAAQQQQQSNFGCSNSTAADDNNSHVSLVSTLSTTPNASETTGGEYTIDESETSGENEDEGASSTQAPPVSTKKRRTAAGAAHGDSSLSSAVTIRCEPFGVPHHAPYCPSSVPPANRGDDHLHETMDVSLASVAKDLGFDGHDLTDMLAKLPVEEGFEGDMDPDEDTLLNINKEDSDEAPPGTTLGHSWADVEQFLLEQEEGLHQPTSHIYSNPIDTQK